MKIELDLNTEGKNVITAYDDHSVTVADRLYQESIVVSPDGPVEHWPPQDFADVSAQHFARLLDLKPEIILFGSGQRHRFPTADVMSNLAEKQVGLEVMDTKAACRAYNFLVGEGRAVLAALLMPDAGHLP